MKKISIASDSTKAITEHKEKINDETINFIEAEAYKIIETYFVRKKSFVEG